MPVNNYEIVKRFLPGQELGPENNQLNFLYTELMDRTKRVGNNGVRIFRTFFHRDLKDFETHFPEIFKQCEALGIRAYTRLAPRSFKDVAKYNLKQCLESVLAENWIHSKTSYASACGSVTPVKKIWLFDVDQVHEAAENFGMWLVEQDLLLTEVPSKKGYHFVTLPFDLRRWRRDQNPDGQVIVDVPGTSLHKDNAVNLYVPDNAA